MEDSHKGTGKRPLQEILRGLQQPIRDRHLQQKTKGKEKLTFCPWYLTKRYLDYHTNGFWSKRVLDMKRTQDRIFVRVQITIHAEEQDITRSATGTEKLKKVDPETGEMKEIPYGDPSSNAESMAFRRACANFGLGAHLYEGD